MKALLLLLVSLGFAFSLPAQNRTPGKVPPTAKGAADGKDAKKADEPPGKVEGMEIARAKGGFLGLQIIDGNFKLTFYDAKKKAIPADVAAAALRWDVKTKAGTERVILNTASEPSVLTSARTIKPPYSFKLFILLMKNTDGGDDAAAETYNIEFRQ